MDATRRSCEYYPRLARKANEDGEVDAVYAHPEGSSIFKIAKLRDKMVDGSQIGRTSESLVCRSAEYADKIGRAHV